MKKTEGKEKEKEELTLENVDQETQQDEVEKTPEEPSADPLPDPMMAENQRLTQEVAEAKDKYIRLYSEFENYRRRTGKEKLELIQAANEQLIKELLPVIDDFERAESALASANTKEVEGFLLISNKLKKVLEKTGVKVLPLGPGSDFDAETQEAITQIPATDEALKGKVVDVVEKGYQLNEKVIRYAKVVVGN